MYQIPFSQSWTSHTKRKTRFSYGNEKNQLIILSKKYFQGQGKCDKQGGVYYGGRRKKNSEVVVGTLRKFIDLVF